MNKLAKLIISQLKKGEHSNFEKLAFNNIVVENIDKNYLLEEQVENISTNLHMSKAHKIKTMLLKPAYQKITRLSPELAEMIRISIYKIWSAYVAKRAQKQYKLIFKENKELNDRKNRILIDVTQINRNDAKTGIQRVTRNITKILMKYKENTILVRNKNGKLITCFEYYAKLKQTEFDGVEYYIHLNESDKIFLLDSSWEYYSDFEKIIKVANEKKAKSYAVVHDLIPLQLPETIISEAFKVIFKKWHNMILKSCTDVICDSRTTANYLQEYYLLSKIKRNLPLNLYSFVLGSNFKVVTKINHKYIRKQLQKFFNEDTFLMVGTIEPRKGYLVAVKAISELLNEGRKVKLLIIGKKGWGVDAFIDTLKNNPYYNNKIVWINDASDIELAWAYKNAKALIAASLQEGFGLPLVEAAQYKLPIICSDIAVFREVTDNQALYFKVFDVADLESKIIAFLNSDDKKYVIDIPQTTWEDSTKMIIDIFEGRRKPYKVLE